MNKQTNKKTFKLHWPKQQQKKTSAASCDVHEWRPDVQLNTSASANRRFLVGGRLHCTCSTTLHSHAWTEHRHSWWTEKQGVSWIHEAMLPKRKHLFSGVYYWAYLSINLWGVMLVFLKDWVCRREVCCYFTEWSNAPFSSAKQSTDENHCANTVTLAARWMKQALSSSNTDNPFKHYLKPHAYLTS